MSLAFPRSMRSLRQDTGRVTLAALAAGLALLLLWVGWLALARIPVYATSQAWEVTRDGTLLVTFSTDAMTRIRPGQTARVTLASADNSAQRVVEATVREVATRGLNRLDPNTARLVVTGSPPKPGETGAVQVVVDQVSPWTVLLQTLGQRLKR